MKQTRTVCIRRHISISMGRLYIFFFVGIFRCDVVITIASQDIATDGKMEAFIDIRWSYICESL